MYEDLIRLEDLLNALLPGHQLNRTPGKELLEAARAWSKEAWRVGNIAGPLKLTSEQIDNGKHLIKHPVFICGVHRSGTTLVRDLLDGHPSLTVLPSEGSFLTSLAHRLRQMPYEDRKPFLAMEWLRRLANPINQPPYWLLGRTTMEFSAYVNFVRAFIAWFTIAEKSFSTISMWPHLAVVLAYATCDKSSSGLTAKYWVDKTPTHEKHLKTIWHQMPEAKIIHVVRNPVDVFLSRKRMDHSLNLKSWLKDMELSYRTATKNSQLNKKNYLVLHYEELCEDPQTSISQVAELLHIELLPCLFRPTVAGKLANVNSSFNADLPAGTILKEMSQLAKEELEPNERKLLSAYLYNSASQLGYTLKPMSKIQSALTRLL